MHLFVITLLFILTSALSGEARAQDYIMGEGDLLKISVYEHPDLTTTTRVSGDGEINVPLLGKMKADGLSTSELEQTLTRQLAEGYIVDPHVSVFVEEYRSKRVTILGEVIKPGLYELQGNATVLEIVSKAGGLTEKAGSKILIKRKKPGQPGDEYITVNIKDLLENGEILADMKVIDGDSLYVIKGGLIYVTGEVKKPGAYRYEEGTTVMKAIALAEGLTEKASSRRAVIIRKNGGEEEVIKAKMEAEVKPDDVISVPESFF